jgi:hypothetical protein
MNFQICVREVAQLAARLVCTVVFFIAFLGMSAAKAAIPAAERNVLLAIYDDGDGANWTHNDGWGGASGTECGWYGISCDGAGDHITMIDLSENNLIGTLPTSLQDLTQLQYFSTYSNALGGTLPAIAGMTQLVVFLVSNNQISGAIPALDGLDSLQYFIVDGNRLTGAPPLPVPPSLLPGSSALCPNYLEHVNSDAWDTATGLSPWYQLCSAQPDGGTFAPTGSMAHARRDGIAILLNDGRVLVAGGYDGTEVVPASEIYDPVSGTFSASGLLNQGRSDAFAALLPDGKVLVGGGVGSQGILQNTAEIYDPTTGQFALTSPMNEFRSGALAANLPDGRVLVVGGYGPLASAETFDPATGSFTSTGSLGTARSYDVVTALDDGRVLVAAGADYMSDFFSTAELYDPASGTFSYTGSLAYGVAPGDFGTISAAKLHDGRVLVPGGNTPSGYVATAQLYDPVTSTFLDTGDMSAPRNAVVAVTLQNGEVLVAGGYFSNSADVYDPMSNHFVPTGSMGDTHAQAMAVALRDGRALVIGGWSGPSVLASAEIYTPDLIFRGQFD